MFDLHPKCPSHRCFMYEIKNKNLSNTKKIQFHPSKIGAYFLGHSERRGVCHSIIYKWIYIIFLCLCHTLTSPLSSHTVNLLTNMPRESYEELLTPLNEGAVGGAENKDVEYDGKNMEAIVTLMDFLDKRLDVVRYHYYLITLLMQ